MRAGGLRLVTCQVSGGVADAVRRLTGGSLGCLIALSDAAGELLQVSQYVIDGANHAAAAGNSREGGLRSIS